MSTMSVVEVAEQSEMKSRLLWYSWWKERSMRWRATAKGRRDARIDVCEICMFVRNFG